MKNNLKKILTAAGAAAFWLGLWMLVSYRINSTVLVPSPVEVAKRLSGLLREADFYLTVGQSLLHILIGYFAGIVTAGLLAVLCHASGIARALIKPAMTVVRSTPVASFIILVLVFIGKKYVPALICFMMVLPVVFGAVSTGIETRNKELAEMLKTFNVSPLRRLRIYEIPSVMPNFGEGCRTSLGLAWKAGIAAEVLCTPADTIGLKLYESKLYLETTDVFCWTAVVIILSLLLEGLLRLIIRKKGEKSSEKH